MNKNIDEILRDIYVRDECTFYFIEYIYMYILYIYSVVDIL